MLERIALRFDAIGFASMTGAPLKHVPYRGSNAAAQDLVAGVVESSFAGLTNALPHRVRENAVNADGCQDHRENRKRREQLHREGPLTERLLDDLLHRRNVEDRLFGIHGPNRADDRVRHPAREIAPPEA